MPDDVKLSSKTRKTITGCWLDISKIRIRVTRGVIHISGTVSRQNEDPRDPESTGPFLERLDEELRRLPNCRMIQYAFDNWRREPSGIWRFSGKKTRGGKH
jgi:hypothetical protein